MLSMDPLDVDFPDGKVFKLMLKKEELDHYAEIALSRLFKCNTTKSIRIADNLLTQFELSDSLVSKAILPQPEDIATMNAKRGFWLPMITVFGVYNGGMSDPFWTFLSSRFGIKHAILENCFIDLMVGGVITKDTHKAQESSILPFAKSMVQLDQQCETESRESMHVLLDLGLPFTQFPFTIFNRVIMRTKKASSRFVDYMSELEKYLIKAPALKKKEWIAIFSDMILESPAWMEILPPKSNTSGESPALNSVFSSVSESVRLLDMSATSKIEVRRFYTSVSELTSILKAGSPVGKALPPIDKEEGTTPFCRWLKEIDTEELMSPVKGSWTTGWW
jgi:hypothetical protein